MQRERYRTVMPKDRLNLIKTALIESLAPNVLEISDESDKHTGHAGARSGKGHFRVKIVSDKFDGLTPLKRQRLVYTALKALMESDIHALSMTTITPDEI